MKLTRREFAAVPALPLLAAPSDLLSGSWPPAKLSAALLPRERYKPFPTAADRAAWESVSSDAREALVEAGARNLRTDWPALPATLFLEYRRNGNRSRYERVRDTRRRKLGDLVIAECLEGKGRFLDDIANGVWTTCEETFWGVPAHLGMQKAGVGLPDVSEPIVDLFAAETSSLLAWTAYLLGPQLDKVSPLVLERIYIETNRRLLTPNLERVDFSWMGLDPRRRGSLNNWTPWINSNWLATALLVERDENRRRAAVHKSLTSLDRFLAGYHDDGGCDEGPSYWSRAGGSLFDCLELLHSASDGAVDFYGAPLVREIGRYIYRAHIANDWFVNFADAAAKLHIAGDLVFRYGRRIGDERMQALGAFAVDARGAGSARADSIGRQLPAIFNIGTLRAAPRYQPLVRDVWLPGIQVMAARIRERSSEGLYMAAQGGHNAESHNHNDVGNFIVFANGEPAIIDVGVETYTAKTFSSQRYEIWTMQSAYHNLPTIGGVMQSAGRQFQAANVEYRADDGTAEFSLNIEKAYPAEAGLDSWRRILRLDRGRNEIEVRDRYALKKPAGKITMTLMTPHKPGGDLTLGKVKVAVPEGLKPEVEEIKIEDARLRSSWGDRLYRVLLVADHPPASGEWMVRIIG